MQISAQCTANSASASLCTFLLIQECGLGTCLPGSDPVFIQWHVQGPKIFMTVGGLDVPDASAAANIQASSVFFEISNYPVDTSHLWGAGDGFQLWNSFGDSGVFPLATKACLTGASAVSRPRVGQPTCYSLWQL